MSFIKTDFELLGASRLSRLCNTAKKFCVRFPQLMLAIILFIPRLIVKLVKGIGRVLANYGRMFVRGDVAVKMSYLVMGAGCFRRKQIGKGILYLALQAGFVLFMVFFAAGYIAKLTTLGTVVGGEVWDEVGQVNIYTQGDNSMLILLYGVSSLVLVMAFAVLYYSNIKTAYSNYNMTATGKKPTSFVRDVRDLFDSKFHKVLVSLPSLGVIAFTILPIIFMACMAFTNYDKLHMPPGNLFTWVGWENFNSLLNMGNNALLASSFFKILAWTLVWAFFATITNYILGMILAMLINKKGIKGKGIYRTIFVLTIAVPQFVTLIFMSKALSDTGLLNTFLTEIGLISAPIQFLTNGFNAKVTLIVVNIWIGIPYTMLITTGILQNIPADLYESARIDGASPFKQYFAITLPYVLFVTTPYLITQFVGNMNNFNVIWLLTGGGPLSGDFYQGGHTDLLVTWLYRFTTVDQNYKLAATIGILTFVVTAGVSLIIYNRSASATREGEF